VEVFSVFCFKGFQIVKFLPPRPGVIYLWTSKRVLVRNRKEIGVAVLFRPDYGSISRGYNMVFMKFNYSWRAVFRHL
jgi:hypothetical protein